MKKLSLLLAMLLCAALATACSGQDTNAEAARPTGSLATQNPVDIQQVKDEFSPVPEDACDELENVTCAADKVLEKDDGCVREFGYLGEKSVNNMDCYVFEVFYNYSGDYRSAGVFANPKGSKNVYRLNDADDAYILCYQAQA
ncbi:MAG: hypothetical protein QM689_06105 [Oscillospiraceae bacterium]